MPKVSFSCEQCGSEFSVYPAFVRYAEKRGTRIKFCSRACTDAARAARLIGSRKRTGENITCAICGTVRYRKPKFLRRNALHFCSEACRIKAQATKLLDRSGVNSGPRNKLRQGQTVACVICGTERYRKKSMIERRIFMTCGARKCISAYSRSLWSLPPFTEEQAKRPKGPSRRRTNFTARQRIEWLGTHCAQCGTTKNLCLDHRIPVSAGGESVRSNSQTLCQPCNVWKGNHIDKPLAKAYNNSIQAA